MRDVIVRVCAPSARSIVAMPPRLLHLATRLYVILMTWSLQGPSRLFDVVNSKVITHAISSEVVLVCVAACGMA